MTHDIGSILKQNLTRVLGAVKNNFFGNILNVEEKEGIKIYTETPAQIIICSPI